MVVRMNTHGVTASRIQWVHMGLRELEMVTGWNSFPRNNLLR